MKSFKTYLQEIYSFIPKSEDDILNSALSTKDKVAKLYNMIQNQTKNKMSDPVAIDFTKPNDIKIARNIKSDVDLKQLSLASGLKLTFGNGSRGNEGEGNQGIAFEKYLHKDLSTYVTTRSVDASYKYPTFMKYFVNKYLKDKKSLEIVDEGGLNKRRPIVFQSGQIYIGGTKTVGLANIGSIVTDLTIKTGADPIYLSLKMGPTVTLFNSGIGKILTKKEIDQGSITNTNGLALLHMLGIDDAEFTNVFRSYKPGDKKAKSTKKVVDVTNKIDKNKLKQFLASGVGYGYHLVHISNPAKDDISEYFISATDILNFVDPKSVVVEYPSDGRAKRVDIKIDTPKFTFKVNIRSKSDVVYPTHIMCDYKIKH